MVEDNLLDDFKSEEASTGELLIIAASLSKWMSPMFPVSLMIGLSYCISAGFMAFDVNNTMQAVLILLLLLSQGVIWFIAARWQLKCIKWTKRVAKYDTAYDQNHWVYLNCKVWEWLVISAVASFLGVFLLVGIGL